MRWTLTAGFMMIVLLAALPCGVGAQAPAFDTTKAAPDKAASVVAATQASARNQGAFKANDVNWTCKGTRCSATAMPLAAMATCQGLARAVGRIESFRVANQAFLATELQQCNSTAEATAGSAGQPQVLTKPAPTPKPESGGSLHSKRLITAADVPLRAQPLPDAPPRAAASPRAPPSNASGSPSTSGPFVPVAIHTAPLTLTGTGIAEVSFQFTPVAVRTLPLTLTGMGVAENTYQFAPVAVRTPRLTLTGTGSVE